MNNFLTNKLNNLPELPGIYIMRDSSGKIIYVGKATSLKSRVKSYFIDTVKSLKNSLLVKTIKNIDYITTTNVKEALVLEESLIKRFQPKYNIIWKDDKRYPYIKITDEKFPFLNIVRTKKNDGKTYFGPYPDSSDMRKTLKLTQKIFGLRPCKYNLEKRKKECLYYFIKKCQAPCIGKTSEKEYSLSISNAIMFLSGKNQKLLKLLEKKMTDAGKKMRFEEAAKLRNIIFAIKNTLEKINIKEITLRDILIDADRDAYLNDLSKLLGKKTVGRIEGFDISNISGNLSVGSMVVFTDGKPDKKKYRKFRIKTVKGLINDFAMISEVIKRRFCGTLASKTAVPDLIIIDGGKGQLSSAVSELKRCGGFWRDSKDKIPKIMAIAKKNEELFFSENSKPLILSKNSLALNLIKYVRDEAHRFAISYHRLLRKKLLPIMFVFIFNLATLIFAREGIIILKNGNSVKGNIILNETGNYTVETKKWSVMFSKKEIKSVKYTRQEKSDSSKDKFVQKMKNTKKIQKKEKEKNYEYDPLIYFYADKYNLDPAFIKAVIEAESNFNPNDVSCKGAVGLMQLMPRTADGLKVNPNNVEENIDGGTKYLNYMYEKFGDLRLALAGYNAGPTAVKKYGKKIPPYKETQNYIEKVLQNYQKHKLDKQIWYFVDEKGCFYISDTPKDKRYTRMK